MVRRDVSAALQKWRAAARYLERVLVLHERAERPSSATTSAASLARLERLERTARVREEEAHDRYRSAIRRVEASMRRATPGVWTAIETGVREDRAPHPIEAGEGRLERREAIAE